MKEINHAYDFAALFARFTGQNIFLTGKAGTGKTTFLHQLRETSLKQLAVVAPTGVAAINAGGTTIHSFFQLPLTPFIPTEVGKKELIANLRIQNRRRKVLRELEVLVIDEVSMVRADVLDAIDTVLRHVRYKNNEPFGGVQMIFIGDLYQLSPVAQRDEWSILSRFYNGLFFFNSLVAQEKSFIHIEFNKVFRQKDDQFIALLNEVRNNKLTLEGRALLESRYKPGFVPQNDDGYIVLTTHNSKADSINSRELEKISEDSHFFKAIVRGNFPEKNFPAEENLELKIGARVMFNKNDQEFPRRFYNGKTGVVIDLGEESVLVRTDEDNMEIDVTPVSWENIEYRTKENSLEVEAESVGAFSQLPLRLAWAITIHKSQGLTFDRAVIDAGAAFAPGQVYVALSRCRSLDGVVLLSRIDDVAIQNDDQVIDFSGRQLSDEELESKYAVFSEKYKLDLLHDVYDFTPMLRLINRWNRLVAESGSALGNETTAYISGLITIVSELSEVGQSFKRQLTQLFNEKPFVEDFLNQRLHAAAGYFTKKLRILIDTLLISSASSDNKVIAENYDQFWSDVFTLCKQKEHWIEGVKNGFSIELYFDLRQSFVLPDTKISAYSRKYVNVKATDSPRPDLVGLLFEVRNYIADEFGMPIYLVANQKSIKDMALYLPHTVEDLLKISGFGKIKSERFGSYFIEVIRDYCIENNLTSEMDELKSKEKENKPKKKAERGKSARISLELYKSGKTIEEIMDERKLAYSTVASHLSEFIQSGELDYVEFIEESKVQRAIELLDNESTESYYSQLKEHFDKKELNLLIAALRQKSLS